MAALQAILSTVEYDAAAPVFLDLLPSTDLGTTSRRVNRVATLDGGAVFNDYGYAAADRTIDLRWRPESAAQEATVIRLVRQYQRLTVATTAGLFLVAPQVYTPAENESRLTLLVERQLDVV